MSSSANTKCLEGKEETTIFSDDKCLALPIDKLTAGCGLSGLTTIIPSETASTSLIHSRTLAIDDKESTQIYLELTDCPIPQETDTPIVLFSSVCAYVSHFSADGTLFVAGFQDSDIKIYSVDNGWKVKKNIRARSLRWTIADTSLSPYQCFLIMEVQK